MNILEAIKQKGPQNVKIIKSLDMGHKNDSGILDFVDPKYLEIDGEDNVSILPQENVVAYDPGNGCIDLRFDDGESACDVVFDNDSVEAEYIQLVQKKQGGGELKLSFYYLREM